ncbi:MAG TPA: iron-containing alcohol dehydrogenase [Polyangiaceae bacterium]
MRSFEYHNPTKVIFGSGQLDSIAKHIPDTARVMLVAGGGSIRDNGIYSRIQTSLSERLVREFWGVRPNPDVADVTPALDLIRRDSINFLLAVGGGSVIDTAKFLAGVACTDGTPRELLSKGCRFSSALPVGVVLTAPGTGSESNSAGAIGDRTVCQKYVFVNSNCFPKFAILDPECSYSLPAKQLANGIVDAYVHVLEQYLTYPSGGILTDRLSESILRTLLEIGPKALQVPPEAEIRENLLWCATLSLNGLIGAGVPQDWTTHQVGHALTAMYGIDHARTLAAILPSYLGFRRKQKAEKLIQYGERVFLLEKMSDDACIELAIDQTRLFFEGLGLPTRLRDHGVTEGAIPDIVANLKTARRIRFGERLDVTLHDISEVLRAAI